MANDGAPVTARRGAEDAVLRCPDPNGLEGTRLALDGHNPFLLSDRRRAWLIVAGHVDLFAVPLRGERPAGARHHLVRAGAGEILLPLPIIERIDEPGVGVLAVGTPGTEVLAVERRETERLEPNELVLRLDRWITRLAAMMASAGSAVAGRIAVPGADTELHAGDRLYGHPRRVTWLALESGSVRLLDGETAWTAADGALPLVGPAWVGAVEPTRVAGHPTAAIVAAGETGAALDRLHARVMEVVARRRDERAADERRRLARHDASAARAGREAFGALAALILPGHRPGVIVKDDDTLLLTACRLVCHELGVELAVPRDSLPTNDNAGALARITAASHLRYRWIVLGDRWWTGDHGPMLGFRADGGAPVALLPRGAGRYDVVDPALGTCRADADSATEIAREAVTIYRPLPETPMTIPGLIRFGARGSGRDLLLFLSMGFLVAVLGLITPVLIGTLFSAIIPDTARSQLLQLVVGLLAVALGAAAFQATQAIALLRAESRFDWQIQAGVVDRLLRLPAPFFRGYTSGDLADRTLGIQTVRTLLTGTTLTAVLSSGFSLVSFGLLVFYSPKLALVAAGLVVLSLLVTLGLTVLRLRHEREQMRGQGRVDGLVVQLLIGIAKLRVAAAEARALGLWARLFAAQKARFVKGQRYANLLATFEAVFPGAATLVLFATASWIMSDAATAPPIPPKLDADPAAPPFDTGSFLAFNAAFGQLLAAMGGLATALASSLTVVPLFERSRPILSSLPEHATAGNLPGELSGDIELSRVTFRYASASPPTLDGLSLRIEPGQFAAIVGPSGSGKSTIFRLLLGFEQPESGGIFYDGRALSTLDLAAVRQQIGVVLQNGRISGGSIFTNIVGSNRVGEEEAWTAARMAGLDRDIEAMPMGMHTVLQEGGGTLSGGQRQRLMIARALLRRPRILLLDEATSALDNRTQAIVTESLAALCTTRIVIAHRLSTIMSVDRIFVLDHGQLVQSGSFAELSVVPGRFAELAQRQLL